MKNDTPRFLTPDASPTERIRAAAANHRDWFTRSAQAAGGKVCRRDGLSWLFTPEETVLAFPRLSAKTAGEALDVVLADCRRRGTGRVGCWSLTPPRPRDLGARLAARGFEWGWRPHWMSLDLARMPGSVPVPNALRITVDDESDWEVEGLPYYRRADAPVLRALTHARPRRTWHVGAWLHGEVVGHSVLHLTTGRLGVAGIYNVGVVGPARRQGIGAEVTLAACRIARDLGCHYALLNAATHIYDRLGFQSLGHGQTWWMHAPALAAPAPSPPEVALAEAIGRGDLKALVQHAPGDLEAPLAGGQTPMALAVQSRQPRAAEWLASRGANLGVLDAWDLGWADRATRLLAERPALANRRSGDWQTTPLHEAVQRGDLELARLLLTAKPDVTLQDTQFQGTPLDWARHLGRTEVLTLLEHYESSEHR